MTFRVSDEGINYLLVSEFPSGGINDAITMLKDAGYAKMDGEKLVPTKLGLKKFMVVAGDEIGITWQFLKEMAKGRKVK